MSEANKELAKLWFEEVWNKGRREAIRELLAQDAVIHEASDAIKVPKAFILSLTGCGLPSPIFMFLFKMPLPKATRFVFDGCAPCGTPAMGWGCLRPTRIYRPPE